jgi:hypothetical protein
MGVEPLEIEFASNEKDDGAHSREAGVAGSIANLMEQGHHPSYSQP